MSDEAVTTGHSYSRQPFISGDADDENVIRLRPDVTIVVPTRNESGNVAELVRRLDSALGSIHAEILFVDDSDDDTPEVVRQVAHRTDRDVRLLHREPGRRDGRLGGAVVAGFQVARAPWAIVIDGDMQHPPESVPAMLAAATDDVDLVYGTRYDGAGDASGLNGRARELVSSASTMLAKVLFPRRLRGVTDPMSGFFAIRLAALDLARLRPVGYKVLLEILAASRLRRVVGVPFTFQSRHAGESKASMAEGMRFLTQLAALRAGMSVGRLMQFLAFAAVGLSGIAVNTIALWAILGWSAVPYLVASAVSANVAIVWNFALLEMFVFTSVRRRTPLAGFGRFWLLNVALLPIQLLLTALLVEGMSMDPVWANVVVLFVVFVARYVLTSTWVYSWSEAADAPATMAGRHRRAAATPSTSQVVSPPDEIEKYHYIAGPQHRWFFWAHVVAFVGIAVSLYGFSRMSYWTLLLLLPLALYVFEIILGVRSSTFRRTVSLPDHQMLLELRANWHWPSVDVFLPTAGEPLHILENTYRYVGELDYQGALTVYVLDDLDRPEVRQAAVAHGFEYIARPGSEFKKAGNLQYAFRRSSGDHIVIFDADFVPRPEFCTELIPYMDDPTTGIVQSPQVFETPKQMNWLKRGAGATQEMFYRFIQPSRDAVGAAICVGTSAIYRREALAAIGGFPQISHSEDVYTGFEMSKKGYHLKYVPVNLSRGICPDNIDSFINQQYRWCEGSMEMLKSSDFHTEPTMTLDQRISFWSGFTYYVSTAMTAFFAPIPAIIMFWLFPQFVQASNYIPLLGIIALWFVVYPILMTSRWRPDVLRVQAIYSFTHAVAIFDVFFGQVSEWVPSGAAKSPGASSLPRRVRNLTVGYIVVTQVLIFAGLIFHLVQFDRYSLAAWWPAVAFALINAYIFVPVAGIAIKAYRPQPAIAETADDRSLTLAGAA
ncbi:MAG TPA: glycosyltransferase [Nakamurella sp.]